MTLREQIEDVFNHMTDEELIAVHNEDCMACNDWDNIIKHMDELDEEASGMSALEILDHYSEVNIMHEYFWCGSGCIMTSGDASDAMMDCMDTDAIIDSMIEDNEDYGSCEVRDLLDDYDEDEEDDEAEDDE